jgi:hypothetical protein
MQTVAYLVAYDVQNPAFITLVLLLMTNANDAYFCVIVRASCKLLCGLQPSEENTHGIFLINGHEKCHLRTTFGISFNISQVGYEFSPDFLSLSFPLTI